MCQALYTLIHCENIQLFYFPPKAHQTKTLSCNRCIPHSIIQPQLARKIQTKDNDYEKKGVPVNENQKKKKK